MAPSAVESTALVTVACLSQLYMGRVRALGVRRAASKSLQPPGLLPPLYFPARGAPHNQVLTGRLQAGLEP